MAKQSVNTIKIPDDIEFRVIGNSFGLLIACAGLLGGTMMSQRSFEYWLDDLVPLLFACFMAFRLFRNFLSTLTLYQDAPPLRHNAPQQVMPDRESMAQLPHIPNYSPEQVVEEVARRIEAKKAEAQKRNKMMN